MFETETCGTCYDCCKNIEIILLQEEAQKISEKTGKNLNDFAERVGMWGFYVMKMDEEGNCPFLDNKKETEKCIIYTIRPSHCKIRPVYFTITKTSNRSDILNSLENPDCGKRAFGKKEKEEIAESFLQLENLTAPLYSRIFQKIFC